MTFVAGRDCSVFGLQLMVAGGAFCDAEVSVHLMQEGHHANFGLELDHIMIIRD